MFKTLQSKIVFPLAALIFVSFALTAPPIQRAFQLSEESWVPAIVLLLVGGLMLVLQHRSLDDLQVLRERMQRGVEGIAIGEPSQAQPEELHDIWSAGHTIQQQLERQRTLKDRKDRSIERLGSLIEQLAEGLDVSDKLDTQIDDPALKDFGARIRQLNERLLTVRDLTHQIKLGELKSEHLKTAHLQLKRLTDSDLPIPREASGLHEDMLELQNALRRLTLQAHLIASDRLDSPLLDETIPGELGDAFGSMVENLRILGHRAQQIASGDLRSFEQDHEGSLHSSFNAMVEGLRGVVSQITQTAVRISTSAEEILAVLHEQELSASHQASGVEETQRTMETLLSSAKKIAESAQTVFKSAERTQANNRIISDRASELKSHTERIAEILESIKEIADRSDLLALNASLEGLRAGEAGKGFTLVANEVRRLAENIKGSVLDIKDLLGNIRQSALSNIMAIEEGSRLSERTTDSALKITLITQQQQSGTEQVTQSMEELSHLINQGLAGTRQVTTAAGELADLSEDMRGLVQAFDLHDQSAPISGLGTMRPAHRPASGEWSNAPLTSPRQRASSPRATLTGLSRPTTTTGAKNAAMFANQARSITQSGSLRALTPAGGTEPPALDGARKPSASLAREPSSPTDDANDTQLAIQTRLPRGKEELNATMRFVGYGDAISAGEGSPTLDISQMSADFMASDYDEMDSLFHELDASPSPSTQGAATTNPSTEETAEREKPDFSQRDKKREGGAEEDERDA